MGARRRRVAEGDAETDGARDDKLSPTERIRRKPKLQTGRDGRSAFAKPAFVAGPAVVVLGGTIPRY